MTLMGVKYPSICEACEFNLRMCLELTDDFKQEYVTGNRRLIK